MAREPFNKVWAENPDGTGPNTFQQPDDTRLEKGWVGGASGTPPKAGEENWWHNRVDAAMQQIERDGCLHWHEDAIYNTGAIVLGSDGVKYEFYDRDQLGTSQGQDPTDPLNRPHIWMEWDGVRPGQTIEWRSETLPEGYIENDGADRSRADYRRIFAAWGTTYGAGDGATTFGTPDDRGEFKRGLDRGRGVDSGRSLTSWQADDFKSHTHRVTDTAGAIDSSGVGAQALNESGAGGSWDTQAKGGTETRPRNNAVVYLTKI